MSQSIRLFQLQSILIDMDTSQFYYTTSYHFERTVLADHLLFSLKIYSQYGDCHRHGL